MRSNKEISEELRDLSSVVAGISQAMPYEVPPGYFEDLPERVSARVLPRSTPFSVPTGYFEGFSSRLMERIKQEQGVGAAEVSSSLLDSIGKKMPFQVPEGYFSHLSEKILSGLPALAIEEEEALSPLMSGLRGEQIYTVPEGYFETFPANVLSVVAAPAPAKVVSFSKRRSWLRYAVAAVATGLIITGGWLRLHGPVKKTVNGGTDIVQGLTGVSDQEIESYVDNHSSQIQEQAEDLTNSTASLDITDNDVKSFLGDVSDNELNAYLEEQGGPKDFPTN